MPNTRTTDHSGSLVIRDVDGKPSRLEGLAVPYGVTIETALGREKFGMGAYAEMVTAVRNGERLAYLTRHGKDGGQIAAVVDSLTERRDGLHFGSELMRVPDGSDLTPAAWDAVGAIRAGISGVSVEFIPGVMSRKGDTVEHRSGVRLAAIAGSYAPAYVSARASLRSAAHAAGGTFAMPNLSVEALTQRRDAIDSEIATVRSLAEAESREPTTEERDSITALEGRKGNVSALITTAEAEATRRDAERKAMPAAVPATTHGSPAVITRAATVYGPGTGVSYFADLAAQSRDAAAAERMSRHRALVTDLAGQIERGVESGELAGAFPTQYYPDLYVPDMSYTGPLSAFFAETPITSPNPIIVPTFATQTGDTAIQATESTALANVDVTTTPKTVTPTTIGGETIVSRQAVDGASPGVDVIIGNQLREILMRDREREIALVLEAITSSGAIADTAGTTAVASGRDLVRGIQTICAQFYTGAAAGGAGARFLPPEGWFSNATDWGNLVAGEDTNGRPLMPYINPMNANGQLMQPGMQKGVLAGVPVEPAWAILAATNHIVARKNDAMQWKSAVLDVRLDERNGPVSIVFAVYQYFVFAVLQPKGVRRYTYTNV